jgi:hypothetical protein
MIQIANQSQIPQKKVSNGIASFEKSVIVVGIPKLPLT